MMLAKVTVKGKALQKLDTVEIRERMISFIQRFLEKYRTFAHYITCHNYKPWHPQSTVLNS